MSRTVRDRSTPHPKPVEKIELSEKNPKWRLAAAVVLLVVGVAALVYSLMSFLSADAGWTEIEAEGGQELNCADDFVFLYLLGAGETSPRTEKRALTLIYTEATETAYRLFTNDVGYEGVNNIYNINHHPNEVLQVEEPLYQAFSLMESFGNRSLYLAPVYSRYDNIFYCTEDSQLVYYDPFLSEEIAAEYRAYAEWAGNQEAVELRLLGENRVELYVSEAYLDFAEEQGIEDYIDFYWMKNAFIADYLAQVLTDNGFTRGSISSYDGFSRNLDRDSGTIYSFNIYDRVGQDIYPAAVMDYSGPKSIVCLRDYPMTSRDFHYYYELANGEVRTPYLDIRDGLPKSAEDSLVCYSAEAGCAEVLLHMLPVYIGEVFEQEALASLAEEGIWSVYCNDDVIYYTESMLMLGNLYQGDDRTYTAENMKRLSE